MTSPKNKTSVNNRSNASAKKIDALTRVSTLLHDATDLKAAISDVLEQVRRLFEFDGATLSLLDQHSKYKEFITVGVHVEPIDFIRTEQADILSGWVIENKKSLLLNDRAAARRDDPNDKFATLLTIPLMRRSEVLGLLSVGVSAARAIDKDDVPFFELVADYLIGFIESSLWRERAQSLSQQLKQQLKHSGALNRESSRPSQTELAAELSRNVNHAINNPLAVILGNVQCLLHEDVARNQKTQSRLKRIESAALKLSEANKKLIEIRSLLHAEKKNSVAEEV